MISILPAQMKTTIRKKEWREQIESGNLLVISIVHPESKFEVFRAMNRNKYIYALADYTFVVHSRKEKGGTWAGAVENLKNRWSKMFVRVSENLPEGNEELIHLGAIPFEEELLDSDKPLEQIISEKLSKHKERSKTNKINTEKQEKFFNQITELLLSEMKEPKAIKEIAEDLGLLEHQVEIWVKKLLEKGLIESFGRPVKYTVKKQMKMFAGL